ncbi:hypothetical protein MIND_00269800 [Mycena indigotica]|uniref:Uncharacterized protein n=1 Tax=Mycena indigotica TaxID=2126181 RepID=A0A8H6WF62_9AGAR|nr:uncharacterized protein MIND_00269800 [Mycena indigotica]KAF7312558.1 hypothetical protein MIND_00269800 [Mycena indigotica]
MAENSVKRISKSNFPAGVDDATIISPTASSIGSSATSGATATTLAEVFEIILKILCGKDSRFPLTNATEEAKTQAFDELMAKVKTILFSNKIPIQMASDINPSMS